MDRSYLSQPEVIEASRKFVCMRLATYENAAEAAVLKNIFVGYSGDLENTTFAILGPDGRTQLVRPGRSPDFAYRDSREMARSMKEIARKYPGRSGVDSLPVITDLRLALNVASCDQRPLVILAGDSKSTRELELELGPWARDKGAGRVLFVRATTQECQRRLGSRVEPGIVVVQSSVYGDSGKILGVVKPGEGEMALERAVDRFTIVQKYVRGHIEEGSRRGVRWQTAIPVTDPGPPGGPP